MVNQSGIFVQSQFIRPYSNSEPATLRRALSHCATRVFLKIKNFCVIPIVIEVFDIANVDFHTKVVFSLAEKLS